MTWLRKSGLAGLARLGQDGPSFWAGRISSRAFRIRAARYQAFFSGKSLYIGTAINGEIGWLCESHARIQGKAPLPRPFRADCERRHFRRYQETRDLRWCRVGAILLVRMLKKTVEAWRRPGFSTNAGVISATCAVPS